LNRFGAAQFTVELGSDSDLTGFKVERRWCNAPLKKVIKTSDCRFAVDMDIHRYISMGRPIMLARLLINYG